MIEPASGGIEMQMSERTTDFPNCARRIADFPRRDVSKSIRKIAKFVSLKYKFIYLPVPKAGTQTVLALLEGVHLGGDLDRLMITEDLSDLIAKNPTWGEFKRFSIVRHPFTRMVSCYIDKIVDAKDYKQPMLAKGGLTTLPESFEGFVDFVCSPEGEDWQANGHWGSQSAILCDEDGRLAVDMVGRLEDLSTELEVILPALGVRGAVELKHKNKRDEHLDEATDANSRDSSYWTAAIERKLMKRFELDYRLFGYEPFHRLS